MTDHNETLARIDADQVERVAKALLAADDSNPDTWDGKNIVEWERNTYRAMARAAITELIPAPLADEEREAVKRLLRDVNPEHRTAVSSLLADDIRTVANALLRNRHTSPPTDEREALTDAALWDFADDLLNAWNIEDQNPPGLSEQFRDLFVQRFGTWRNRGRGPITESHHRKCLKITSKEFQDVCDCKTLRMLGVREDPTPTTDDDLESLTRAAGVEAESRWGADIIEHVPKAQRTPTQWLDLGMAAGFVLGAQWVFTLEAARDAKGTR